jgi:hypothetical protein
LIGGTGVVASCRIVGTVTTDVDRLPVPPCLRQADLGTRAEVHRRPSLVDTAWWNAALADHRLPGGPVAGHPGLSGWTAPPAGSVAPGARLLARTDLFALGRDLYHANLAAGSDPDPDKLADDPDDDLDGAGGDAGPVGDASARGVPAGSGPARGGAWRRVDVAGLAALRMWWHVVAWDGGMAPAGRVDLVRAFAADLVAAARVLREAAAVAAGCPEAAYAWLRTGLAGLTGMADRPVRDWEPGALTAFLYVAGSGCQNHPCLVLNGAIVRTLTERCGWESLPAADWSAPTYGRYCRLVRRWAVEETARRHRLVYPDQVERWLASAD